MASAREMRLRIRSVRNIAQVTRALETVSASKARKATAAMSATRPYAAKAWQVLTHIARQPGRESLHPLLFRRAEVKSSLVVLLTSDRGLAGAYNSNIVRFATKHFDRSAVPVRYIAVGRKGRDQLARRGESIVADFSNLPATPAFVDVSAIGRLAVDEFLKGLADEVYLAFTDFISMARQEVRIKKLLPLEFTGTGDLVEDIDRGDMGPAAAYEYEPDQREILDEIIPRFTALQVFQAILVSQASEHAARMLAMHNATDNARDLVGGLQLAYNKVRQQAITGDILDIVGGVEALGG